MLTRVIINWFQNDKMDACLKLMSWWQYYGKSFSDSRVDPTEKQIEKKKVLTFLISIYVIKISVLKRSFIRNQGKFGCAKRDSLSGLIPFSNKISPSSDVHRYSNLTCELTD